MSMSPEVRSVILNYQGQVAVLRRQVDSYASAQWSLLDSWRDADIERLVQALVPVSLGAQRRMVALTDAYLAAVAVAQGARQAPSGVAVGAVTGAALRGVDLSVVYARTGPTIWRALEKGKPLGAAVALGRHRMTNMLMTDLQLTKTHTVRERQRRDDSVVGYRRVLRPGGENCALCVLASTQRYTRGDLMEIHPGCGCDVAEIRGSNDPGQVLDADAVDRLHQQVQDEFGSHGRGGRGPVDYRDVMVRQHGEIGPVLTWRHQAFTGPADLN